MSFSGHFVHWINSQPHPSCTLVSSLADLTDGVALLDLVKQFLLGGRTAGIQAPLSFSNSVERLKAALLLLSEARGLE